MGEPDVHSTMHLWEPGCYPSVTSTSRAGPQLLFVRDEFAEPRCRLTGIEIPIQLVMGKFPPKKINICHLIMGKTWKNIKKWIEIAPGRIRYQVCLLYKQKPSCSGPLIRKHLERSWVGQIILYHISNYNCNTNVRWIRLANGFPYNGSI